MSDQWIKFSERSPRDSEFPPEWVWLFAFPKEAPQGVRLLWETRMGNPHGSWEFWKPADVPEPPKREPTQEDADADAWGDLLKAYTNIRAPLDGKFCWFKALAYEREQVRDLLAKAEAIRNCTADHIIRSEQWNALARRVGLTP